MSEARCGICKFRNEEGQCVFSAPAAVVIPMEMIQKQGHPQPVVLWPPVDGESVCGQFQPKVI